MIYLFTFIPEKNLQKIEILSYTWPDVEYKTFKVIRYDYFIWIDSIKNAQNLRPILNAYNKITFKAIDPTDSIYLHFIKGFYVVPYWTDTVKNNLIIDSIKFFHNGNYKAFNYYTPGDTLIIVKFPFTINPNDSFRLEIYYHGITNRSGSSFGGGLDLKQNNIVYTDNEPFGLRRWLPSFDLPYEKPQIVDAKIKTKIGWKTIANGKLIDSIIEGNWITYHYRENYPIAPYLIVFASSNKFTIQTQTWNYNNISMPIYHYLDPNNNSPSLYLPNQLTIFSNKYGIYPFYDEKYAEVQIFEGFFGGAMENQTNTFTRFTNYEILSAHEISHHWWGNMVTCATFKDIFINESFATYSEAVYDENNLGYGDYGNNRGYMGQIHGDINRYLNYGNYNKPIYNPGPSLSDVFDVNITYSKGSAVLHALRLLFRAIYNDSALGDNKFFQALKYYGNKRKFSYARVVDFENDIKEFLNSENKDTSIGYFFNQWIFKPGHPQFQFLISKNFNGSTYDLYIKVNQNQPNNWARFKIPKYPIRIKFSDNSQIDTTINIDSLPSQTFYFNFIKEPTTIIPDYPNHYIDQISVALIPENEFIYVKIKDNKLKLSIPRIGNYELKIYNSLGRIVLSKNLQINKNQIEMPLNLPKGIYFIEIKGNLNYKSKIINF